MALPHANLTAHARTARIRSEILFGLHRAMEKVIDAEERKDEAEADRIIGEAVAETVAALQKRGLPPEIFDERRLASLFLEVRRARYAEHPRTAYAAPAFSVVEGERSVAEEPARAADGAPPPARPPVRRREPKEQDIASMIDDMLSRSG
ncbi:MAG: hypothetical protein JJU00_08495 [Opitutales bacterium]|nr:hypothetical protein [Opitutales bacterium]